MARALKIETREKEDNALDALCRLIATQTGHGHVRPLNIAGRLVRVRVCRARQDHPVAWMRSAAGLATCLGSPRTTTTRRSQWMRPGKIPKLGNERCTPSDLDSEALPFHARSACV